jgi:hypothetical protein
MKLPLIIISLVSLSVSCVLASEISIKEYSRKDHPDPLVSHARSYNVIVWPDNAQFDIQARFLIPLNAWSLNITQKNPDRSVSAESLAGVIEKVWFAIYTPDVRISSITVPTSSISILEQDFTCMLKKALISMSGNVRPKSKLVFTLLCKFYRQSKVIECLEKKLEYSTKLKIKSVLPGSEINFEKNLIGRPWKELNNYVSFGFVPEPSFTLVFEN